jgi:hypothetical protein
MKTYKQAKKEYDKQIQEAVDYIKHIKKTNTFDFPCPQCKKVKKILVIRMKQGRSGLKWCSNACRQRAQRARDKVKKLEIKLGKAKDKVKELENENQVQ